MKGRPLRPGEKALWDKVASTVKPIAGPAKREAAPVEHPASPARPSGVKPKPPAEPMHTAQPAMRPGPARPTGTTAASAGSPKRKHAAHPRDLDRKERRRLARGTEPIGGRIDLHGMTQEEAHSALVRFVTTGQASGLKVVLVITGKGRGEGGVLRRAVPSWLSSPALSPLVVGFGAAGADHGGDGALYVRLRAKRQSRR